MSRSRDKAPDFNYRGDDALAEEVEESQKQAVREFRKTEGRNPTNDEFHTYMYRLALRFGAQYTPDKHHLH